MQRLMGLFLAVLMLLVSAPVLAQTSGSFPFDDIKQLTPEQIKIQKYKLQRLRVQPLHQDWYIIRGINEKIDDATLLKMLDKTELLAQDAMTKTIGNGVALGGLALIAGGGLMLTDLIKFQNSTLVGIGTIIVGGALVIGGEVWAGNLGDPEGGHLIDRREAEALVLTYNQNLKKELGVENVPNLE